MFIIASVQRKQFGLLRPISSQKPSPTCSLSNGLFGDYRRTLVEGYAPAMSLVSDCVQANGVRPRASKVRACRGRVEDGHRLIPVFVHRMTPVVAFSQQASPMKARSPASGISSATASASSTRSRS